MSPRTRTLLGRTQWAGTRILVYQTPQWLEIDESEEYEIRRRRIFFDEILLVTYSRRVGWPAIIVCLLLAGLCGVLAWLAYSPEMIPTTVALGVGAVPFLIFAGVRLVLRVDRVTVFGTRTQARIDFAFRKARAREVFDLVCRLAREQQSRAAQSLF